MGNILQELWQAKLFCVVCQESKKKVLSVGYTSEHEEYEYVAEIKVKEQVTAPFNNMRTLKFKAQLTNAFFATVNQMFAGSSQLSTAAERVVIKSLCKVQATNRIRK